MDGGRERARERWGGGARAREGVVTARALAAPAPALEGVQEAGSAGSSARPARLRGSGLRAGPLQLGFRSLPPPPSPRRTGTPWNRPRPPRPAPPPSPPAASRQSLAARPRPPRTSPRPAQPAESPSPSRPPPPPPPPPPPQPHPTTHRQAPGASIRVTSAVKDWPRRLAVTGLLRGRARFARVDGRGGRVLK